MNKTTFFKSWLLLLCMIVGSSAAWADEVTVNMSEQGYSNADNVSSIKNGGLTISFTDGSTATAYYATGTAVRIYGGGSATFSVKDATISKVELTFSGTSNAPSANTVWSCTDGSGSGTSGASATWTGSAKTVKITRPTGNGHWRLQLVTVTYTLNSLDNSVATTVTIDGSGITNKDLYAGTNAGQLAAVVKDVSGASISGATVTWASSKEDVATVADDGKVTLVAVGTTTITASYAGVENQYKPSTANYELTVTDTTPFTGGVVTFVSANDNTEGTSLTKECVTITATALGASYYQAYKGDDFVISTSQGKITKIVFTCTATDANKYGPGSFGTHQGYSYSGNVGTWEGNENSVTFNATNNQVRATKVEVTVVISNKESAGLSYVTTSYSVNLGEQFTAPTLVNPNNLTVTYNSSDENVASVDATTGVVTLKAAGTTTITATFAGNDTYEGGDASYTLTIVDPNAPGTENNPYTIAQARAAIDAGTGVTGVYATGTVSEIVTAYNSQFGNITYNISTDGTTTADQLQAYRGKSYNGDKFTSADDIQVGDVVVVYGNLTKYESTYEFAQDNQLVSLNRPVVTTPTLTVTPANVTVPYTGGSDDFTVTANNVNNAFGSQIRFFDPADPETAINEQPTWIDFSYDYTNLSLSYSITEENQTGADRTACFKFYIMCDNGGALSNLITVTQQTYVAPTVATLPFEFNNGKADIEGTDGLTQEGIGSDYSASPKLKFDTTGDWLLLHFDERPGILTFDIKNNSFSGGTFTVQTSEDGVTYTDLEAYTTITGTQNEEFDNLDENVRYIKWIYTNKSNGNVGLGNIKLAKYAAPAPSITIAATDAQVNVDAAGGDGNISFTYETLTVTDNNDFDVVFFDADDNEINQPGWIQSEVNAIDNIYYVVDANTDAAARTAYLKVHAIDDENNDVYSNVVTITQEGVPPVVTKEYFVKVTNTSDLTDGQYLIVNEENGIAFDGSLTTLDAGGNNKEVVVSENIALAETSLIFTYDANAKTLKSASGYYIGQTSDANGLASDKTTTYENEISFDDKGNADIVSGSAYLRYNAASNADRFRYYKSSSYTNQKPVQLYKLTTTPTVAVKITDAGYATYCSKFALDFSAIDNVYSAKVTNENNTNTVNFQEVTGKKVPASEGVLLKGAANTYNIPIIASADPIDNDFVGVLAETPVADVIYVLMKDTKGVGFYKTGATFTVGAHTAYLPAQAGGNGARDFIGFGDDISTGISGELSVKSDVPVYNLNGQRVNNAQKGLYIVNGRKVVIK